MKRKFNKMVGTKISTTPVLFSAYSIVEATLIKDCKSMGFTNKQTASLVNEKIHHGSNVRSYNGIAKINFRKLTF